MSGRIPPAYAVDRWRHMLVEAVGDRLPPEHGAALRLDARVPIVVHVLRVTNDYTVDAVRFMLDGEEVARLGRMSIANARTVLRAVEALGWRLSDEHYRDIGFSSGRWRLINLEAPW